MVSQWMLCFKIDPYGVRAVISLEALAVIHMRDHAVRQLHGSLD